MDHLKSEQKNVSSSKIMKDEIIMRKNKIKIKLLDHNEEEEVFGSTDESNEISLMIV